MPPDATGLFGQKPHAVVRQALPRIRPVDHGAVEKNGFLAPITIQDNVFNEALDIIESSIRECAKA